MQCMRRLTDIPAPGEGRPRPRPRPRPLPLPRLPPGNGAGVLCSAPSSRFGFLWLLAKRLSSSALLGRPGPRFGPETMKALECAVAHSAVVTESNACTD